MVRTWQDLPLVEIVWTDASIDISDEAPLDDLSTFGGLVEMRSIGYLVRRTRREVVLATDLCAADNDVRHSNTIPRGWIKSIIALAREPEATHASQDQQEK